MRRRIFLEKKPCCFGEEIELPRPSKRFDVIDVDYVVERITEKYGIPYGEVVEIVSERKRTDFDEFFEFDGRGAWVDIYEFSNLVSKYGGAVPGGRLIEYVSSEVFLDEILGEAEDVDRAKLNKAFAVCTSVFKKAGYIGNDVYELTDKGIEADKKHRSEPDHEKKVRRYEEILAMYRNGPRRVDDRQMPAFMIHCIVAVHDGKGKNVKEA